MKLEVGKRYVLRNGEVTGSLYECGERMSGERKSWLTNGGHYYSSAQMSGLDIVAEYVEPDPTHIVDAGKMVEPQPQQPLRWVENCKPDKPGIWAQLYDEGNAIHVEEWSVEDVTYHATFGTRCYLGPIPEILPPVKKVAERLWLEPTDVPAITGCKTFIERWFADGASDTQINDWIRTDRTREREI